MDKYMLNGKTAIITGASYGMGQAIAELFAEEGASVILRPELLPIFALRRIQLVF